MREDARPVNALPEERVVREAVDLVPRDLLSEHPAHSGQPSELRQGRRIAERVGQPHLVATVTQAFGEPSRAEGELAAYRLAGEQVAVRLDPHPPDRDDGTGGDGRLQPREEIGLVLLQPRPVLGGGQREDDAGTGLGQVENVGDGPGDLASGLTDRPEPGRVDVGVPDGADLVGALGGPHGERRRQDGAGGRGGADDVGQVEGIHRLVEGAQDRPGAGGGLGQHLGQAEQRHHVSDELADLVVHLDQVGSGQAIERGRVGGLLAPDARGREGAGPQHLGVGGGLDVEAHLALVVGPHRNPRVSRVDALDDPAALVEHQALGLPTDRPARPTEVDDCLKGGAAQVRRHARAEAEPGRPPGGTPRHTHCGGGEVGGEGHLSGDGLPLPRYAVRLGHLPGCGIERGDHRGLGRADPLGEDSAHPGQDDGALIVHLDSSD